MDISDLFDSYSRRARLYPPLLTLLPALSTILAWFPGLLTSSAGAALLTIVNACGLLYLLAELSRSRGQNVQKRLLTTWGGWPTTKMLRHSDASLPGSVKVRYHTFLAAKTGAAMPSVDEEQADLAAADGRYASALLWLKEQCRGPDHALILNENTSFGFRRNLMGLKFWGVVICALAAAWPLLVLATHYGWDAGFDISEIGDTVQRLEPVHVGAFVLSLISMTAWICVVRAAWVKEAADNYAVRLLAGCDVIGRAATTTTSQ